MSTYTGRIQMTGVTDRPLDIYLDLEQETLAMWTFDGEEIGEWPLDEVQIIGKDEGFTFRIHGIPAWVRTNDDGAFATEVGLQWAPPRLRRLMATHARMVEELAHQS